MPLDNFGKGLAVALAGKLHHGLVIACKIWGGIRHNLIAHIAFWLAMTPATTVLPLAKGVKCRHNRQRPKNFPSRKSYMASTSARPKALQETSVAPAIRRAKS